MPDARVLSALLGIGFVMTHIFFNRGVDQSRPRTRGQAKIEAERERQSLNMSHVLDSWTCSWCRFENRCLRSARARRNNLECTNCRNDFICAVSPRKVAHKALLDERPVQCRTPYRVGNDVLSPNFTVRLNEHSFPGTQLYERFYQCVKDCDPSSVRLAFHGTSVVAARQILKHGMDPARRINTQGDWFTIDINYALTRSICREDHVSQWGAPPKEPDSDNNAKHIAVICFAVYMPKTIYIGEHIVCVCEKHSLPLSVLEFPRSPTYDSE